MSSVAQRNVMLSGLTANSKCMHSQLALWLVTNASFSFQECKIMPSQELHHESLSTFNSLLGTCNVVLLCQQHFHDDVLLPEEVASIKFLVKEFYNMAVDKVRSLKKIVSMYSCLI
jgi:hypothetical protein